MSTTDTTQRNSIKRLSASVVNKIAAGEVIERPASVVKELLENSVDSGAGRIEVSIENGGIDLIRVCDDGCGIAQDELELAVTSHATSKIRDADELFRVDSFGFRGEALASISEVSQFSLCSRLTTSSCGFALQVNGGHRESVEPYSMPTGTIIEVRNLFFNTPVRRKFLKTAQTERGHVIEAFTRIALANPHLHLKLNHNGKAVFDLPPTNNWSQRIGDFFGPEISDALIPVSNVNGDIEISGFVVNPTVNRSNNRMQYLFLNGRYIRDRSLQHALSEAYRGLIMTGRYPLAFLKMSMPPELVDVNVHPAKLEVRFQDSGKLYSQLLATIRNKFLTTDLTANAQLTRPQNQRDNSAAAGQMDTVESRFELLASQQQQQEKLAFPTSRPQRDWTAAPAGIENVPHPPAFMPHVPASEFRPFPKLNTSAPDPAAQDDDVAAASPQPEREQAMVQRPLALQVHNTYLITETDEGMVVIDQHALHERIIYEQLREKVLQGKLERQKLLVPEPVSLPPAESAAILGRSDLLEQIGIVVEPFGGDTVLISAYPAMLSNQNPAETLKSIIDLLINDDCKIEQRDLIDELLHMIACKAAIKAGDKLTPEEINELLEHRDYCQDAHHCPHGRPTALVFSREELDKRFKRI